MWIALIPGFVSISCGRHLDQPGKPVDVGTLMLRARLRLHLERLQQRHPDLLGGKVIQESESADYRFRIVAPKAVVAALVSREVLAIEYANFKSEVFAVEGRSPYEVALHRVWSDFLPLQRPPGRTVGRPDGAQDS